ncbi:MAG: SCO family protein [Flavobacteriaceae bacterium]|nr:SCO family protein [Flavobacteriaceae bacterium]
MSVRSKKSTANIGLVLLIFAVAVVVGYFLLAPKEKLPVYSPSDVNPRLVDYSVQHIRKNHKISDFNLINQAGDTVTNDTYKNKIYVADFFFTRCATICPIMTGNMAELQKIYKDDDEVMLLSHSVTPVIDSVPILKMYAENKGIDQEKWNITTGDKKHIYELARKSYFATLDEGDGGEQDFIHTEQFILVDKKRQIRGYYDGTDKEEIERIKKDIEILKKEQ